MLAGGVPLVPFYSLPKRKWQNGMEKKKRMDIDEDISSSSDEESVEAVLEPPSDDEEEYMDEFEVIIKKPVEFEVIEDIIEEKFVIPEEDEFGNIWQPPISIWEGPLKYVSKHFSQWKERQKNKRLHYMMRAYHKKARQNEEKRKLKVEADKKEAESNMMLEAYRKSKLIKANRFQASRKFGAAQGLIDSIAERDVEATRMDFNCYHFQRWAAENFETNKLMEAEAAIAMEQKIIKERKEAKERERKNIIKDDGAILKLDMAMTQEVLTSMRQCGISAGVNVTDSSKAKDKPKTAKNSLQDQLKAFEEKKDNIKMVTIRLKDSVDFLAPNTTGRKPLYVTPFNVDLAADYRNITNLLCKDIGERGAISLGTELLRGAGSRLTHLDINGCQSQTRGFVRLLSGVKMGGLLTLYSLKCRRNCITGRGMDSLRDLFQCDVFEHLRILDLGENEIGDVGVGTIAHMIVDGQFQHMEQINLQNNLITDAGFHKVLKIMSSVHAAKCPNLSYFCLKGNKITSAAKNSYSPIPPCINM